MTLYYVKTDGNDALDGLSEVNAWLTIDHAQSNIIAADEVHIAAGTYDETSAFIFNPPAGTIWTGADTDDPALTKLFTIWYENDFTVTNDNVEIHGCQVGHYTNPHIVLNNTGFQLIDCLAGCYFSGLATDLIFDNVQSVINDPLIINFVSPDPLTDGRFTDVVYPAGGMGSFTIYGAGNTVTRLQTYGNIPTSIYCSDAVLSDCLCYDLAIWGSSGNSVSLLEVTDKITVLKDASAGGTQTITNCKDIAKATVAAGASLTLSWYLKKFYESSNSAWTTIDSSGQPAITIAGGSSNITFTERNFAATPDANIDVLIETWETADDQNKAWKVSATGSRTVTFQLGDMLPDTEYDLKVGGGKVSSAVSDGSGVVAFPPYTGSFSEKEFETAKTLPSTFVPRVMIF